MLVRDILARKGGTVITIHTYVPVAAAVDILSSKNIGALPVLDAENRLVGMFSERDVIRGLSAHGAALLTQHIEEAMTPHAFVCKPTHHLGDIMKRMTQHRVRHLPVVVDGRIEGLISIGDVVKHRLDEARTEANVLRDLYLAGH